jgi:hypothetical protein
VVAAPVAVAAPLADVVAEAIAAGVFDAAAAGVFDGAATAPAGVLEGAAAPLAGLVGVLDDEPDAQAERTENESTMVRRTDNDFDSLNLALYILLSLDQQSNLTVRLD